MSLLEIEHARLPAWTNGCMMCALAQPSWDEDLVVARNESALLRLNRIPSRPKELMVVLREHHERVTEVSSRVYGQVFALVHAAARVLELDEDVLRVFVAQLGAPDAILTSYPHLHVHVVPLYEGGEEARPSRVFSFSSAVYTYEDGEGARVAERLRRSAVFADLLSR